MFYCPICNSKNIKNTKFCTKCGSKISGNTHNEKEVMLSQRYKVISPLKVGGMAGIYLAKDSRLNSMCAVKELDIKSFSDAGKEYSIQNFKSEAELLANLRHPGLPRVIDYFYEQGKYYLVMDYISGDDLLSILERDGIPWLPEEKVLTWAIELCDVLIYIHNQVPPIVYRDLKPSNIMLREKDQKVLLIDFGLAQMVHIKPLSSEMAFGTLGYAPPEQFSGREEPRSDVYALGATLHHLLTGTPPGMHFNFKPVREINREVSPELEAIVMKALKKDLSSRYESALIMQEDLLLLIDNQEVEDIEELGPVEERQLKKQMALPINAIKDSKKNTDEKRISVFLVEDDNAIRKMLRVYIGFNKDIFIADEAVNGREAIEKFKNFQIPPDVILMDISMPDIDGITATEEIIKINPSVKIIILTALQSRKEIVLEAFRAGATGYMLKETALDNIAEAIRNSYYGGAPIEPTVASILINEVTGHPTERESQKKEDLIVQASKKDKNVAEILSLCGEEASGKITVDTPDEVGYIYIQDGKILHASYLDWVGIDALEYIVTMEEGILTFNRGEPVPMITIDEKTEEIIKHISNNIEDWKRIRKIISNPQDIFKFDLSSKIHAINFTPEERDILPYFNGDYTVLDISLETGCKYFEVAGKIYEIYSMGILKKHKD